MKPVFRAPFKPPLRWPKWNGVWSGAKGISWHRSHCLPSPLFMSLFSLLTTKRQQALGRPCFGWFTLFSGFTAIGRLFDRERTATRQYLRWTIEPLGLILGKLAHAILTTTGLTALVLATFLLFLGWPSGLEQAGKPGLLVLGAWLGGLSVTTTLVLCDRSRLPSAVRRCCVERRTGPSLASSTNHFGDAIDQRSTSRHTLEHPWRTAPLFGRIERWNQHLGMHSLPLHLARMNSWNSVWKIGGIVLLAYVIVRGFSTPLQPGLVEASPTRLSPGKTKVTLSAVGQPFLRDQETLADFQLILRSEEELLKTQILDISEHRVTASINFPLCCPHQPWMPFCSPPPRAPCFWAMPSS